MRISIRVIWVGENQGSEFVTESSNIPPNLPAITVKYGLIENRRRIDSGNNSYLEAIDIAIIELPDRALIGLFDLWRPIGEFRECVAFALRGG